MGGLVGTAAEFEIVSTDWSAFAAQGGAATAIGSVLSDLLCSIDVESASAAWARIEESVFSQGTIYSVAEPAVTVVLAAMLDKQPPWLSGRLVDLLFFILKGSSPDDPELAARCLARAREGLWLLVGCARAADGWGRDNILEVLEVLAPDRTDEIRAVVESDFGQGQSG